MVSSAAVNHASEIKIKVLPSFAATPLYAKTPNNGSVVDVFSNSNGNIYSEDQSPMLGVKDQQNKLQAQAIAAANEDFTMAAAYKADDS